MNNTTLKLFVVFSLITMLGLFSGCETLPGDYDALVYELPESGDLSTDINTAFNNVEGAGLASMEDRLNFWSIRFDQVSEEDLKLKERVIAFYEQHRVDYFANYDNYIARAEYVKRYFNMKHGVWEDLRGLVKDENYYQLKNKLQRLTPETGTIAKFTAIRRQYASLEVERFKLPDDELKSAISSQFGNLQSVNLLNREDRLYHWAFRYENIPSDNAQWKKQVDAFIEKHRDDFYKDYSTFLDRAVQLEQYFSMKSQVWSELQGLLSIDNKWHLREALIRETPETGSRARFTEIKKEFSELEVTIFRLKDKNLTNEIKSQYIAANNNDLLSVEDNWYYIAFFFHDMANSEKKRAAIKFFNENADVIFTDYAQFYETAKNYRTYLHRKNELWNSLTIGACVALPGENNGSNNTPYVNVEVHNNINTSGSNNSGSNNGKTEEPAENKKPTVDMIWKLRQALKELTPVTGTLEKLIQIRDEFIAEAEMEFK